MTRERLLRAAVAVFAERGFHGSSVRRICQRARANPAAVKYYFGNKEGLYHEVLRSAASAFSSGWHGVAAGDARTPDALLREMIRAQLQPALRRNKISRYLRVLAWEDMAPTRTFKQFLASEGVPVLSSASLIARRLLPPEASREELSIATIWLLNQAAPFVRGRDVLAGPPFNLKLDSALVDRLTERLSRLALDALVAHSDAGPTSPDQPDEHADDRPLPAEES